MSVRNNEERFGAHGNAGSEAPPHMPNPMDFVTPTEYIDLPSKGKMYPEGHPLHNQDCLEIRFMTAKSEDILTSRTLLKKGIALDRLIDNLIVDKRIKASTLLTGDRNAIVISARSSAYGSLYETKVACPSCGEAADHSFNLEEPHVYHGDVWGEYEIAPTGRGTYNIKMPISGLIVEIRLLNGEDEIKLVQRLQKSSKNKNAPDNTLSDQMRAFIVSVNGYSDFKVVDHVVKNITAAESRYLRNCYKAVNPDLKITDEFECLSCGHEQELEVPFGADFFWPDR
tara:strand:- start:325 stop:1176 length:852 start_codon:yes stop_codon:yes gene_type:complete